MKILNHLTNERIKCKIQKVLPEKLRACSDNFKFDWLKEFQRSEVYSIFTLENPEIIQGLIGIRTQKGFLLLTLIERAGFGKEHTKLYEEVAKLLIAFACKFSIEVGLEGCVAFDAKSALVDYYAELAGAIRIGTSNRMIILPEQAQKLITLLYEE